MKSRTAARIIVVLAVVVAVLLLLGGVSKAAEPDDTATETTLPLAFSFQAGEVQSRGSNGAHCWEFTADQALRNYAGRIQAWPAMEAMWCSGRYMRKVTNLVYLHCLSKGGFYSYDGCKRDPGKTGYSYLGASGSWHYHWVINGSVFTKTPDLSIRYYANGVVTGTWYWQTA